MVGQAVRDVRTAPIPPPADPPAAPTVAALRTVVDDLAASSHAIGELMLEVAPAYPPPARPPTSSRCCASRSGSRSTTGSLPGATP
ncbi:hypothetical protein ACGFR6_27470 [Streptomyces sp. NPDC048567]|uniref:hypothetical protein n=1 Tax=Streptomyces sp. NPDC048567 TaxID=3365570 RepID=UPI003720A231